MQTFSLDTNCVIALEEGRVEAASVRALANAHAAAKANVGVIAISASERQKDGRHLESFTCFQNRLKTLGLEHLDLILPMFYFDLTFWDCAVFTDEAGLILEQKIHQILFPNIEFRWPDFCRANNLDPSSIVSSSKWRNAKCDVQALWGHINAKRDIFVTSDENFHKVSKKAKLIALGAGCIERPIDAQSHFEEITK
jgi:hypothetical protein